MRARRRGRPDAVGLGRDYTELLSPLLAPTAEDLNAGLALFERSEALGAFDAVLAACVARAGIQVLVSADTAFADVAQLSHLVPDRDGVDRLLNG